MTTNTILFDLPAADYHAAEGVSQSMLQHMDPPARLPVYLTEKREVTPYMRLGTLIHAAILEPDKPMPMIAVRPPEFQDWRSKESRLWREAQERAGIYPLTPDEFEDLQGCVEAIKAHEMAQAALRYGWSEVSIFRNVELPSGRIVFTKSRLDFVTDTDAILDIKKVQDGKASDKEFPWLARDRGLHIQAAYYLDAWNALNPMDLKTHWCWIVVEESAPHLVNVLQCSQESIQRGRAEYFDRLERYAECREKNKWPGYSETVTTIDVPRRKGE